MIISNFNFLNKKIKIEIDKLIQYDLYYKNKKILNKRRITIHIVFIYITIWFYS